MNWRRKEMNLCLVDEKQRAVVISICEICPTVFLIDNKRRVKIILSFEREKRK